MKTMRSHCSDDEERIRTNIRNIEEEYIRLEEAIIRLAQDAGRRIDCYADEIIELKQKREEKHQ